MGGDRDQGAAGVAQHLAAAMLGRAGFAAEWDGAAGLTVAAPDRLPYRVTVRPVSKWGRALALLQEAQKIIGHETWGEYVDVESCDAALADLIDTVDRLSREAGDG